MKVHCKDAALKFLLDGSQTKTKIKKLKYYSLETQPYLLSEKMTTKNKKCLFKFRTHMVNVGYDYGNKKLCTIFDMDENDNQEHTFSCIVMKFRCPELVNMMDQKYDDIFGNNTPKLIKISKICKVSLGPGN